MHHRATNPALLALLAFLSLIYPYFSLTMQPAPAIYMFVYLFLYGFRYANVDHTMFNFFIMIDRDKGWYGTMMAVVVVGCAIAIFVC